MEYDFDGDEITERKCKPHEIFLGGIICGTVFYGLITLLSAIHGIDEAQWENIKKLSDDQICLRRDVIEEIIQYNRENGGKGEYIIPYIDNPKISQEHRDEAKKMINEGWIDSPAYRGKVYTKATEIETKKSHNIQKEKNNAPKKADSVPSHESKKKNAMKGQQTSRRGNARPNKKATFIVHSNYPQYVHPKRMRG